MEKNNVDTMEEIELDLVNIPTEEPKELLEYEKLLLEERNRVDYEHAINLVKYGCFKQYDDPQLDFSKLDLIKTKKMFKGAYRLYRNIENYHLFFICPLVEDNKGDQEAEKKDLKPYSYNVIEIEFMDNETYKMVLKAARNNIGNIVSRLYTGSLIGYIIAMIFSIFMICFNLISNSANYDMANNLMLTLYYSAPYIVAIMILTPLIGLFTIYYKNYKKEN